MHVTQCDGPQHTLLLICSSLQLRTKLPHRLPRRLAPRLPRPRNKARILQSTQLFLATAATDSPAVLHCMRQLLAASAELRFGMDQLPPPPCRSHLLRRVRLWCARRTCCCHQFRQRLLHLQVCRQQQRQEPPPLHKVHLPRKRSSGMLPGLHRVLRAGVVSPPSIAAAHETGAAHTAARAVGAAAAAARSASSKQGLLQRPCLLRCCDADQ